MVRVLATKPDNLILIPKDHEVERRGLTPAAFTCILYLHKTFTDLHMYTVACICAYMHMLAHTDTNKCGKITEIAINCNLVMMGFPMQF